MDSVRLMDYPGLEVVPDQSPDLGAHEDKQVSHREPLDYFQRDAKYPHESPAADKVLYNPQRDQKMVNASDLPRPAMSSRYTEEKQANVAQFHNDGFQRQSNPPPPRRSRRRLWIAIALLSLIIVIVVAVPLGVVFGRKAQSSGGDTIPITNTTTPDTSSSAPVPLNRTRMATLLPRSSSDKVWYFWQDTNKNIRLSKMNISGEWEPSINLTSIKNVALGTPLAACVHQGGPIKTGINHLVYFTEDGYYADIINDPSQGDEWHDGGLYGQLRPGPHDPHFNMAWATTVNGTAYLYQAGALSGWVNEVVYDAPLSQWSTATNFNFPLTWAYGGLAVQQVAGVTQLHVVAPKMQTLVTWVRDASTDPNARWQHNYDSQMGGIWPNTSLAAPHLYGQPTLVYYQGSDTTVQLANTTGVTLNSTWIGTQPLHIPAMPGTTLHVADVLISGTQATTLLMLQETGTDITIYSGTDPTKLTRAGTLPG